MGKTWTQRCTAAGHMPWCPQGPLRITATLSSPTVTPSTVSPLPRTQDPRPCARSQEPQHQPALLPSPCPQVQGLLPYGPPLLVLVQWLGWKGNHCPGPVWGLPGHQGQTGASGQDPGPRSHPLCGPCVGGGCIMPNSVDLWALTGFSIASVGRAPSSLFLPTSHSLCKALI